MNSSRVALVALAAIPSVLPACSDSDKAAEDTALNNAQCQKRANDDLSIKLDDNSRPKEGVCIQVTKGVQESNAR